MAWCRLRFPLLALWLAVMIFAVPRALHVGHGLTGTGLDNPRSQATWADQQLSRIGAGGHGGSGGGAQGGLSTLVEGLPLGTVKAAWRSAAAGVAPSGSVPPAADVTALAGHPTAVVVDVRPGPEALQAVAAFQRSLAGRSGVSLQEVTMDSAGGGVLTSAMTTLKVSARVALPLLAILLFLVYDSVVAAALPLLVALVGAVVALAAVDLLEPYMQLSAYLTNIVSFLALGVGIDYSLFLSSRFRTALRRSLASGVPQREAVAQALGEAMRTSGVSVFFSAVAVAASMLALLLPRTPYWTGLAIGGCAAVLAVLLATLTLLPALLAVVGPRAEWGRLRRPEWLGRFWPAVARGVARRPAAIFVLGMAVLAAPALWSSGLHVHTPANPAKMLAPTDVARLTVEQQQRDYGPGSIAPLPIVLRAPGPLSSAATWTEVAAVSARLQALPAVLSLASPTSAGAPPALLAAAFSAPGGPPAALRAATGAPDLIALSVTSRYAPDDPRTGALLGQMDAILARLPHGWRGAVGGPVALLQSFNSLVAQTLPGMVAVVAGVAFVVLFAASGSLGVAVLAVVFDGLVALATAGILVFAVQGGRFGFEALPLDASITPLIFVILFGLSMDYEVILIHRIREHAAALRDGEPRPRPAAEAARRGLGETGGMITGAGLIMVTAFGALLVSPLQLMRTLALGLGIAILLDTWIVRALLVPTSIALLGQAAWWPWGLRASGRLPTPAPEEIRAAAADHGPAEGSGTA